MPLLLVERIGIGLAARGPERFFFEVGDAGDELRMLEAADVGFDRVNLRVQGDDLTFTRHLALDVRDVVGDCGEALLHARVHRVDARAKRREAFLHPLLQRSEAFSHLGSQCFERRLLCHGGSIARARASS